MSVGFIGAGQLTCALARGFTAAGERVVSVVSFLFHPSERVSEEW